MTQKNSNSDVIWAVAIATIILLAAGLFAVSTFPEAQEPQTINVPTAAEIAGLINIPAVDNTNLQAQLDSICEKIDCDEVEVNTTLARDARRLAIAEIDEDDFMEILADFTGIDEDYLVLEDLDVKEEKVSATSDDEAEDGNVKVEGFLRIEYSDSDDDDSNEVVYVVVTADITDLYDEENDQEVEYSIRKVTRNFEFDD